MGGENDDQEAETPKDIQEILSDIDKKIEDLDK
jgi:hypothetical protein